MATQAGDLTAYLIVKDAAAAIRFYATAFGAEERFHLTGADGRIGHAELTLAGTNLMLADEWPDFGALSPPSVGGSPVKLHLYVADCDATVARAVEAGATLMRPVVDQFYGDRSGMIVDPFGHSWFVASRKEEVTPEEMQRRWDEALAGAA